MTRLVLLSIACAAACAHEGPIPTPVASGTLTGTVDFIGMPCTHFDSDAGLVEDTGPGCAGPMAGYEVVVRSKDARTIVAKTKTDSTGHFTIALPAGDYTILTEAGLHPQDQRRNDVTVTVNGNIAVALRVDTGVR